MEELNSLFNSLKVTDLSLFYSKLLDTDELVEFCDWRKQHNDTVNLHLHLQNIDKPKDVIVVILTPRLSDEYALNCKHIFNSIPIVFVSGRSPYFNEPRWFNIGIGKALELGAKWVIFSSDDIYEIDEVDGLVEKLLDLDNTEFDNIWIRPEPDYYHSYDAYLTSRFPIEKVYRSIRGGYHTELNVFYDKFDIRRVITPAKPITKPFRYWFFHRLFPPLLYHKFLKFRMTSDFTILSSEFIRKLNGHVLNELFVTQEDIDLSIRLLDTNSSTVDFRIGSYIGGHYLPGIFKALKEVLNLAVFNYLIRKGYYPQLSGVGFETN